MVRRTAATTAQVEEQQVEEQQVEEHPEDRVLPPKRQLNLRVDGRIYDMVCGVALREGRTMNAAAAELIRRGHDAERELRNVFGSVAGYAVARALLAAAEAAVAKSHAGEGLWLHNADFFDQAAAAIVRTLDTLRPGEVQEALAAVEAARRQGR
jgi:hypothetical protein